MKNSKFISGIITAIIMLSGCGGTGNILDNVKVRDICYSTADIVRSQNRTTKQLDSAELHLAIIRGDVLRGEKRSPLAKSMATHGLQNNELSAVAWAEGALGNEGIEEMADTQVWFVEVRHAKRKYEELEYRIDSLETKFVHKERQLRALDFSYNQCLDNSWY